MKTLKLVLWLMIVNLLRASDAQFLKAIAEVETGDNAAVVGKDGEVSAYQILPINWQRYTQEPVGKARSRTLSFYVATKHLAWIRRQLLISRPEIKSQPDLLKSPYLLALAWKCGPYNTRTRNDENMDYAMRVASIYDEIHNSR